MLLVLPTGAGKTATASQLIAWAVARGRRCLFVVHRREIVLDTHRRLVAAGVPCGVVMAGERASDASVQVCSVQTLTAREQHPAADLIVWDEAHHCTAGTYRDIRSQYPSAWHLGLTATPERSDGAPLGDAFEALVAPITVGELVAAGHLAPIEVIAPPTRLQSAIGATPADAWREHGGGRPAVVFCGTIAESRECVASLGERAAHIDGGTPRRERDEILRRFEAGELDVVSNCAVLTEGWDSARAEVCVLARGCGSLPVYLQTIGRVRRTGGNAAKRCLLIDLAGAAHEHGMPDEDREWSLDEGQEQRRKSDREALTTCLHCGAVTRYASRGPQCRKCSAPWPEAERVEVQKQPLAAVVATSTRREREEELARLRQIARQRAYKPAWVGVRFKEKFGYWPRGL
ncbi:MAG: DEAD/DEAH box helicase [Cytophagia bacterium]|nr:DEAD/DEAH box helicase [Cytophagia bacterium]